MNLGNMRTEFYARGFDYLNVTRANYFINSSYCDLCEDDAKYGGTWPFLETTLTSNAPITFADLRQVLSVQDLTQKMPLLQIDRRTLYESLTPDITTVGVPLYWWLEGEVMKVYPVATDSLEVRYAKVPPDLAADSDSPLVPDRYCDLIIDGAVIKAYEDSDNLMSAYALRQTLDEKETDMANSLLFRSGRAPDSVLSIHQHEDW